MYHKNTLLTKLRQYYCYLPVFCDYWWVNSSQVERNEWAKLNLIRQRTDLADRVSQPYGLYSRNPYADGMGLEIFHQYMYTSHCERCKDGADLCRYPISMILLFGGLKTCIQISQGFDGMIWMQLVCFILLLSFSHAIFIEWINRHVMQGWLIQSQLKFEAWAILLSWQERDHPWYAAALSQDALSMVLSQCLQEIKATWSKNGSSGGLNIAYQDDRMQFLSFFASTYRAQMKKIWLVLACLYYGLLVWMSLEWVGWIMQPLAELEQQWLLSE